MGLQDKGHAGSRQDDTDDLLAVSLSAAVPYGAPGLQEPAAGGYSADVVADSPLPPRGGVVAAGGAFGSPTNTTPLSMDLTNNNSLQSLAGGAPAGGGSSIKKGKSAAAAAGPKPSPRKSPRRSTAPQQNSTLVSAPPALPQPVASVPHASIINAGGGPSSQDFTRNITGSVPALSTLVEEDEDGMMMEESGGLGAGGSHFNGADFPSIAEASDADSFGMLSPALQTIPEDQNGGLGGAVKWGEQSSFNDGGLSPVSPFVLKEMKLDGGARAGGGQTPAAGTSGGDGDLDPVGDEEGLDPGGAESEDLKQKWGFTPGAEDTLDASHGETQGDAYL